MGGSSSKKDKNKPPPFQPTPAFDSRRSWEPLPPLTLRQILIEHRLPIERRPYVILNTALGEQPIRQPADDSIQMRIERAHYALTQAEGNDGNNEDDDDEQWLKTARSTRTL